MFVVTGATGNVGREVVTQLAEEGVAVRAVVRDPATAELPTGVGRARGDLSDPASLRDAFAGAEAVFLMPGYPGVATAAKNAGAARIVQLSSSSVGSADLSNAVVRSMTETETEMRESGLPWTAVRPVAFMSNALRWQSQLAEGDIVRVPFPDLPIACVHPADIAAVATRAMLHDSHRYQIYRTTGPRAMLPRDQVAALGDVLGRELKFEGQTNDEARRSMLESMPPQYVAAFFDFYVNRSIDETTVRPTVQDVTGRPARTFATWAMENAHRFA